MKNAPHHRALPASRAPRGLRVVRRRRIAIGRTWGSNARRNRVGHPRARGARKRVHDFRIHRRRLPNIVPADSVGPRVLGPLPAAGARHGAHTITAVRDARHVRRRRLRHDFNLRGGAPRVHGAAARPLRLPALQSFDGRGRSVHSGNGSGWRPDSAAAAAVFPSRFGGCCAVGSSVRHLKPARALGGGVRHSKRERGRSRRLEAHSRPVIDLAVQPVLCVAERVMDSHIVGCLN